MPNKNLHAAKTAKNDEFYTQLSDIEKELYHYRDFFRGKVVFCNCDDPEYSNFWKYFQMNFIFLGLKKLISTHYEPGGQSYKMEIVSADLPSGQIGIPDYVKTPLAGDGDFRSEECIEILKEADVVVTNPPFSCYSSDTEVKTSHGWKLFKDVDIDKDLILSLNPETSEVEYVKATEKLIRPVQGELYHYHNRSMDLLVTDNHNMPVWNGEQKFCRFVRADELKPSHCLKLRGFQYSDGEGFGKTFAIPSITQKERCSRREIVIPEKTVPLEDWLEFLGFWLADGYWRDGVNSLGQPRYTVGIKQREENEEYVMGLFHRIGFAAKVHRNKTGNHNYEVYSKQLWTVLREFGKAREKYIPDCFLELERPYLKHLLHGYEMGDGQRCPGYIMYSSASKSLIENLQELALKVYGVLGQIHLREFKARGKVYSCWYMRICLSETPHFVSKYGKPQKVPYDDSVYCLTLERNHIMLVRRNDCAAWSGNCFREYVAQLMMYDKKFIIIGNINAITYKEFFPLLKDDKVWVGTGFNLSMIFRSPYKNVLESNRKFVKAKGYDPDFYIKTPAVCWYTNVDIQKRHTPLDLYMRYHGNEDHYPKYDNYDAINVDKTCEIPEDYDGVMGVPITFLDKYCPEQFEIIALGNSRDNFIPTKDYIEPIKHLKNGSECSGGAINCVLAIEVDNPPANTVYYTSRNSRYLVPPYARILIRRR